MRFFADHCVPNSVARALEAAGHEVMRLRDHLPQDTSDEAVISTAQRLGAVLLTLDSDFVDIVRYPPAQYGGIVVLLVHSRPQLLPQALALLTEWLAMLEGQEALRGKLCLAEAHRLRIRS